MPGLAIALTLQISDTSQDNQIAVNDIVSFISSLLLGSDQSVRNWFSQFVKAGQKVSNGNFKYIYALDCFFTTANGNSP